MKHGSLKLLSQITQLGIMMLTPIILCTLLGVWLDGLWQCSPWISLGGALLGIAAAFRNLFVWNGKMTRQAQNTQDPLRPKGAQEDDGNEKYAGREHHVGSLRGRFALHAAHDRGEDEHRGKANEPERRKQSERA